MFKFFFGVNPLFSPKNVMVYRRTFSGHETTTEYTVQELTARVGRETQRHGRRRDDGQSFALTRAMNAVPKPALASRFAMKARADNKFSRKRSRRLGGSPAAHGSTDAAELRQLCQKRLL